MRWSATPGVAQDVPPYVIAQGNHATPFKYYRYSRRGFSREGLRRFVRLIKPLYRSGKTLDEAEAGNAELAESAIRRRRLPSSELLNARSDLAAHSVLNDFAPSPVKRPAIFYAVLLSTVQKIQRPPLCGRW